MILKLYYDEDIATLTFKGMTYNSGNEFVVYDTNTSNDFKYTLKNGAIINSLGFWATNSYIQAISPNSNSAFFSQANLINYYNELAKLGTIDEFLVLMSANYSVNGVVNTTRNVIAGGDYTSKTVTTKGKNDTITVNYGSSWDITKVMFYYRDPVNGGDYLNKSSYISADKHSFSITVPNDSITADTTIKNLFSYFVIPTLTKSTTPEPEKTDINVKYNDGLTTQTIGYHNQSAGTISGTIKAASGYIIKNVTSAWYRNPNTGMQITLSGFTATKVSDTEYNFSLTLTENDVKHFKKVATDYIHISLTTEKKAPEVVSADLTVKYNDGLTTQTLSYPNQTAGTVSGELNSANGYIIKGVTSAWYLNPNTGLHVDLENFTATKISNYKYSFSFKVSDTNLTHFKTNPTDYITIALTTEKEKGNIAINDSGLVNCTINPSTIVQDTETKLTLSADLGYILNGLGSYTVDGQTTSFTCSNVQSYSFTVTANAALSISFTATKVETPANASISHTYVLDQDGYNLLGKQFIQAVNTSGDGFTQYDYSKFVNYLYQIPFTIPEDITKPSTSISIGKTSLDVSCSYVTHETLTIDLGVIDLPTSTSIDYNVLGISLFVPFTDKIELPKTVLGSKIKLTMQVNLLNESAVLIVYQNNTVIFTCGSQVFTDLPLYFTAGTKDILVKTFKTRYQNTINQAYITISFNKPVTNLTSYRTNEHGTLSDYKGFTRVSYGTLKNSISQEIDGLIINKLKQGVIIK